MKRTATMLFVLTAACCLAFALPALAVGLMSEPFLYGNGNLAIAPAVSGGNWANHSGAGTDIQVTGGVAALRNGRIVHSVGKGLPEGRYYARLYNATGELLREYGLQIR